MSVESKRKTIASPGGAKYHVDAQK